MLGVRGFSADTPCVFGLVSFLFLLLFLHYHQAVQQGAGGVIKSIVYPLPEWRDCVFSKAVTHCTYLIQASLSSILSQNVSKTVSANIAKYLEPTNDLNI